ncbi:hypothetical protein MTO96_015055 [Rhipicephalus appendiculatus]
MAAALSSSPVGDGAPPSSPLFPKDGFIGSAGLLQMLLNAERSQELIWNSVRMGGGGGGGGTAMNNSFGGGPPSGLSAKLGAEGGLSAFSLLSSSTHPFGSLEEAALRQRLQGSGAAQPCPWGNTGGRRVTLLEESWKDLFLLYMAQWSVAADIVSSLPGLKGGNGPSPTAATSLRLHQSDHLDGAPSSPQHAAELHYIQDVMRRLRQLSPDDTECSCLKAVVLFKPETIGLCDVHPVEMLQDQAQCVLGDYIRHKHPRTAHPLRSPAAAPAQPAGRVSGHC